MKDVTGASRGGTEFSAGAARLASWGGRAGRWLALASVAAALVACSGTEDSGKTSKRATTKPAEGTAGGGDESGEGDVEPSDDETPPAGEEPGPTDGGGDNGGGTGTACTRDRTICLQIAYPASVDKTKVGKLYIGFFASVGGPPDFPGKSVTLETPRVEPGATVPLEIANNGIDGQKFVGVTLYMKGGGTTTPKKGVDYVGYTKAAVPFNGTQKPVKVAEAIALELAN
jgi:hypothetical protein